jgi:hypothetical protein
MSPLDCLEIRLPISDSNRLKNDSLKNDPVTIDNFEMLKTQTEVPYTRCAEGKKLPEQ